MGTPFYISPEIFRRKAYTYSTDIWSLGCILYELCTLSPPFTGRDMDDLARNVQRARFKRIPSGYSRELWDTVVLLLKADPARRPAIGEVLTLPL